MERKGQIVSETVIEPRHKAGYELFSPSFCIF